MFESICLTCLWFAFASHCPNLIIVGGQCRVLQSREVQLTQKHKSRTGHPPARWWPSTKRRSVNILSGWRDRWGRASRAYKITVFGWFKTFWGLWCHGCHWKRQFRYALAYSSDLFLGWQEECNLEWDWNKKVRITGTNLSVLHFLSLHGETGSCSHYIHVTVESV